MNADLPGLGNVPLELLLFVGGSIFLNEGLELFFQCGGVLESECSNGSVPPVLVRPTQSSDDIELPGFHSSDESFEDLLNYGFAIRWSIPRHFLLTKAQSSHRRRPDFLLEQREPALEASDGGRRGDETTEFIPGGLAVGDDLGQLRSRLAVERGLNNQICSWNINAN